MHLKSGWSWRPRGRAPGVQQKGPEGGLDVHQLGSPRVKIALTSQPAGAKHSWAQGGHSVNT